MAKKKYGDHFIMLDDFVILTARYGSPRTILENPVPMESSKPSQVPERYGSPRQDPEKPDPKEPNPSLQKVPEPHLRSEFIIRYGCPRPEPQKKSSKRESLIKIIKGK